EAIPAVEDVTAGAALKDVVAAETEHQIIVLGAWKAIVTVRARNGIDGEGRDRPLVDRGSPWINRRKLQVRNREVRCRQGIQVRIGRCKYIGMVKQVLHCKVLCSEGDGSRTHRARWTAPSGLQSGFSGGRRLPVEGHVRHVSVWHSPHSYGEATDRWRVVTSPSCGPPPRPPCP